MSLSISDICILFARKGGRAYDGEPVTQLEHALQAATRAEQSGASAAIVTAALLHDLGHLLNDQGETPTLRGVDDVHQYAALPFLRGLFGDDVLSPIKLHVDAKRYLCATRSEYYDALSVDKVSVHAEAVEKVAEWDLHSLSVNQDGSWTNVTPTTTLDVAPGDTLQLRAHLQAYKDSHNKRTVSLSVHIPESAVDGSGQVVVSGGADLATNGPDTSMVDSFEKLIAALKAVPHNNDLVTQVTVPDPSGTNPIKKTHHVRLKKVTRGSFTLAINVATPCGDDCGGDGDGGLPVG